MASTGNIRAGRAYVELSTRGEELKGLNRAQAKLRAFSAGVDAVGNKLLRVGMMLAIPMATSAKVFADFDSQMAKVSTMLDEPEKYMKRYRKSIEDMSMKFGESTETLTNGLYDILSASVPPAQALDVLTVAVKAAKAGMTDTGVAADAITTVLNAYGLSADKAADVSDWLFSVVKKGKTTFAELAPSIGLVATIAASAGVSIDEMGAAIATMTRNGVKTENTVTSLNAIIGTFLSPSVDAAAYASKELGFQLSSTTLKAEGLRGVFQRISSLPPDAIARLFPNIRALRGVLPALQNMEGFANDIEAMKNRAGAASEAFEKMMESAGARLAQYKQIAIDILRAIGDGVAEALAIWGDSFAESAKSMSEWIKENKGTIVQVTTLTRNILILAAGMKTLAVAITLVKVATAAIGGLATVAIVAAVAWAGAVNYAFRSLANYTAKLSDVEAKRNQQEKDAQEQDKQKISRLNELAEKRKLNTEEEKNALSLIEQLRKRYGDLGITYDSITKKITGMAGANELLNKKMAEKELLRNSKELKEKEKNIDELRKEQRSQDSYWWYTGASSFDGSMSTALFKISNADKQILEETKRRDELRRRQRELKAILSGEEQPATTKTATSESLKTIEKEVLDDTAFAAAKKRLAQIDEDMAKKRRSNLENEIVKIKQLAEERRKLLEAIIATEEAKGDKADMAVLAGAAEELSRVAIEAQQDIENQRSKAEKANQRGVTEMMRDIRRQFEGVSDTEREREDRDKIAADPFGAIDELSQRSAEAQKRFLEAAEELKQAVIDAKADGKIIKSEQDYINQLKDEFNRSYGNFASNRDQLQRAMDATRNQAQIRGDFRVDARAMGGNELMSPIRQIQQSLNRSENLNKEMVRLLRKLDVGGINVS